MKLIGRHREIAKMQKLITSAKSEFLAVYGRRRVGKTFLIRSFFENQFDFYITGLAKGNTKQQLSNFTVFFQQYFLTEIPIPTNWLSAFHLLIKELEKKKNKEKCVIFIDEMPWLATPKSDFMMGLEFFWNAWASAKDNILLIVCGSAASWMINELIKNTGGLYNRVTERIKLEPFTLQETEAYFSYNNILLDRYQISLLYMVMGGIPFYLDQVEKGKSAMQNIEDLCFRNEGKLRTEFSYIFSSLFKHGEKHELVLKTIFDKGGALTRDEIIKYADLSSGGGISKVLAELEESGFIGSFQKFGSKTANISYSITDFYTLFYFRFIQKEGKYQPNIWLNKVDNPAFRAWSGFAFEQLCFAHIPQIKRALQIEGVSSNVYAWLSKGDAHKKGSQIDLVIDRRDNVINLFEIKFSLHQINIDKAYNMTLLHKIQSFKEVTHTQKAVFLTTITTYGLSTNAYSRAAVQNELTLDDLFDK